MQGDTQTKKDHSISIDIKRYETIRRVLELKSRKLQPKGNMGSEKSV